MNMDNHGTKSASISILSEFCSVSFHYLLFHPFIFVVDFHVESRHKKRQNIFVPFGREAEEVYRLSEKEVSKRRWEEINIPSTSPVQSSTGKARKKYGKKATTKYRQKQRKNDEKDEVNRTDTFKINRYILYFCVVLEKNILYNRLFISYIKKSMRYVSRGCVAMWLCTVLAQHKTTNENIQTVESLSREMYVIFLNLLCEGNLPLSNVCAHSKRSVGIFSFDVLVRFSLSLFLIWFTFTKQFVRCLQAKKNAEEWEKETRTNGWNGIEERWRWRMTIESKSWTKTKRKKTHTH